MIDGAASGLFLTLSLGAYDDAVGVDRGERFAVGSLPLAEQQPVGREPWDRVDH
jgi:hypothetical protein